MSFFSWFSCWRRSPPAPPARTGPSPPASTPSCARGTKRSSPRAALARPSSYLIAACLCLLVAGALSLADGAGPAGTRERELLERGWQLTTSVACPPLREGAFYELSGETATVELLALPLGRSVVSRLPLPETYTCREIPGPQFVEEIP